jgi:hypothetical protein
MGNPRIKCLKDLLTYVLIAAVLYPILEYTLCWSYESPLGPFHIPSPSHHRTHLFGQVKGFEEGKWVNCTVD